VGGRQQVVMGCSQRSVFLHRQGTHPIAISHCKLRLAVRERKVSRRRSDCCGWFVGLGDVSSSGHRRHH
jgi:hypothetical protein